MDAVLEYSWIAWLVLILIFVVVEMLTLEFIFLMIAIGSLCGLVAGLLGAPWWLQLVIAAVVAVLLLLVIKPPLLRMLHRGGDPARSNVDALIGMSGVVVRSGGGMPGSGGPQVRLANGETWTARAVAADGGGAAKAATSELVPGESILVVAIDGATAMVVAQEGASR